MLVLFLFLTNAWASSPCPNEPTTWELFADRDFTPLATPITQPNGKSLDAGWTSTGQFKMVQDPTAPSAPWVGQEKYPAGHPCANGGTNCPTSGTSTMGSWPNIPGNNWNGKGYKKIYMCFWMKVDPQYVNEGSGTTKQIWFLVGKQGENRVFTDLYSPSNANSGTPGMQTPATKMYASLAVQGLGNTISAIYGDKTKLVTKGTWQRWEVKGIMDAQGKGSLDVYLDGAQLTLKPLTGGGALVPPTPFQFTKAGESPEWRGVKIANVYGGGADKVPHDQYVWIDDLRVRRDH